MILKSGRIIPNWILRSAFELYNKDTPMSELIIDIEEMIQDELNETDHSKLSTRDAFEIYGKVNEIWPDYEFMLDEFFEKHDLGEDEYEGGDDDNDDGDDDNEDDNEPENPEDNMVDEEPRTHTEKEILLERR